MNSFMESEKTRLRHMGEAWDRMAKTKQFLEVRDKRSTTDFVEYLKETVGLDKEMIVLDVCCGDGILSNEIAEMVGEINGVDFSENMLRNGKNKALSKGATNIRYFKGVADSLPFKDDSFDCTLCLGALYYLPSEKNAKKALEEMIRVTKGDGTILITELLLKDSVIHKFWNIIRSRRDTGFDIHERHISNRIEKMLFRVKLKLRRLYGKRIISDGWLWLCPDFFINSGIKKFEKIKVVKYRKKRGINFRYDIMLSND